MAGAQDRLIEELGELFSPIVDLAGEPGGPEALFALLGWDLGALLGLPAQEVDNALGAIGTAMQELEALQPPFDELDDLIAGLEATAAVAIAIADVAELAQSYTGVAPAGLEQLGTDVMDLLVTSYLARRTPKIWALLQVLTVVREPTPEEIPVGVVDGDGRVQRLPSPGLHLDLARIGKLLKDPVTLLKEYYLGVNGLATAADAALAGDRIFGAMDTLMAALGGGGLFRLPPDALPAGAWGGLGESLARASAQLKLPIGQTGSEIDVTMTLSPADAGDLGLVLSPGGTLAVTETLGGWQGDLVISGSIAAVAISSHGVLLAGTGGALDTTGQLEASLALTKLPGPGGAAFTIGSASGSHLQVGNFQVGGHFLIGAGAQDYGFDVAAGAAEIVISTAELDGFLKSFLPPDGIHAPFEFSLGWSHLRGVHVSGSIGIEVELLLHLSLGGILDLDSLFVALRVHTSGDIKAQLAASATLRIGPLTAVVQRIGLSADIEFPAGGGNLGPAQLTPAFKPPSGLALAVKAGPVGGGGYLFFDPDAGEYAGALQLDLKVLKVSAIGILTTKLPGNQPGFSLLIIIAAEFQPIQLGYGFALIGVGGLLGINRTVNTEALAAGLKDGTLGSILMPHDVVANALKIISDLRACFPVAPGRFVVGPMVSIGWGASIIRLDLGLILELPSPLRLILVGRVTVALPPGDDDAVVLLRLEILGELDFDKRRARMLGTLRDSRIAAFPISGDLAALLTWDEHPTFLMSVGGFHPAFKDVPPGIPQLGRLAIALCDGDNPRLRLEAYTAITSNSVQAGARLELYVKQDLGFLGLLELRGHLAFDTLILFVPFSFLAEFSAELALLRNGDPLLAVNVSLSLSGPTPWHGWGDASFKLLGIEKSVSFDVTIGEPEPPPAIAPVDAGERLIAALQDRANWSAALPEIGGPLVKLRAQPEGSTTLLVHSAAQLTVRQRVVPLDMTLERFGVAALSGARRFSLGTAADPVSDPFAPGEFLELTDDEKLSRPSFEPMHSGARVATVPPTAGARRVTAFDYRTIVVDEPDRQVAREWSALTPMSETAALASAAHAPAARSALRTEGQARFAGPSQAVSVIASTYVLAGTGTLTAAGVASSYTDAAHARADADAGAVSGRASVQVVGAHEVAP